MKLGEFVELKRGYDLPKKNREEGTVPLVSSSGKSDFHNVEKVKGPGVVTGRYGTIGKVYYIEENFWPLNTTLYVKDFKGNDPLFVYYFLKTISYSDYSDKAAVPGINRNHLHKAEISVPVDPVYQRQLATILWDLDRKIELNRQTNETLEQIAQAIFKSWFVDFEPVKAKIQARHTLSPTLSQRERELVVERAAMCAISGKSLEELEQLSAETQQQLKTTAALFPDALVETELGEIPEGWAIVRFKQIIEKYIDNRGKTPPVVDSGIPLLEVKHLPENSIKPDLNTTKYVDDGTYENWFRAHLKADDIIISTVGTIGRICMVPDNKKFTIAQNLLGMRFNRKKVSPYFMYYQMDDFRFRHDVDARLIITVQASIKRKDLETIDLLSPPVALQNEFESFIKPFVSVQQSNQGIGLSEMRDALLPKLLSGELSINNPISTNKDVA